MKMRISRAVGVDVETTGFKTGVAEIIEVGAVSSSGAAFSSLVKPLKGVPAHITKLTGIAEADVENAPTIEEVFPELLKFIYQDTNKPVLVGHCIKSFDLRFINAAFQQCGLPGFSKNSTWDTMEYFKKKKQKEGLKTRLTLEAAVKFYGLGSFNYHRALGDAKAAMSVFRKQFKEAKKLKSLLNN